MKFTKLAVAAIASFAFGNAYAFHSGGVAECEGCHTMHNSLDGSPMIPDAVMAANGLTQYQAGPYLLQGNQSENCLNCHQHEGDTGPSGYHISTADADLKPNGDTTGIPAVPLQITPGGDFGWIRADVPFTQRKTAMVNEGHNRGHNIVAPGYGYNSDPVKTKAPGGTFDATKFYCSSCHDPHGRTRVLDATKGDVQVVPVIGGATAPIYTTGSVGNATPTGLAVGTYRLLGGSGYTAKSNPTFSFNTIAPVATAPGSSSSGYNRTEATNETVITYGKGMSEYCANCHPAMLMNNYNSGTKMLVHPAGNAAVLGATIAANYKAYVKSGALNGTGSNYTSLVPFETQQVDTVAMKATAANNGAKGFGPTAEATDTVSCLSCHRAHASAFDSMLRFPHENEFMTIADAAGGAIYDTSSTEGKINRGFYGTTAQATALYGRPATEFAPYQRLLCNKCHAKD